MVTLRDVTYLIIDPSGPLKICGPKS